MNPFFSKLLSGISTQEEPAALPKAKVYHLRRVCCQCKAEMGTKPCEQALHGMISHGYCPTCTDKIMAELKAEAA